MLKETKKKIAYVFILIGSIGWRRWSNQPCRIFERSGLGLLGTVCGLLNLFYNIYKDLADEKNDVR